MLMIKVKTMMLTIVTVVIAILGFSLFSSNPSTRNTEATELNLPDGRSFSMGFTYQPYDWSEEAFETTFNLIGKHGDLIAHYFDNGVPWAEAFQGLPYHPHLEEDIQRRINHQRSGQQVLVAVNMLANDRLSLAGYLAETDGMERPGIWRDKDFDDAEVIQAYLNWCRDLIQRLNPDYLLYGFEIDSAIIDPESKRFQKLLVMVREVYTTLKQENPSLKVVLGFNLGDTDYMEKRKAAIAKLLPYTDIYAVSTYPFKYDGIGGDSTNIPVDWFDKVREIAPDKPFAISETAFIAKDFTHPTLGVWIPFQKERLLIPGRAKWQAGYFRFLLESVQKLDTAFINVWAIRDLDLLFEKIAPDGNYTDPMWKLINHSGLYDAEGKPRESLAIWDAWNKLPKREVYRDFTTNVHKRLL